MTTVQEAIKHCEEKAKEKYAEGMLCHANPNDDLLDGCIKCAKEHEQLAEWLKELEQYRTLGTVEEIIKHRDNLEQENHEYSCIGTMEELKEAREKQVAKKPTDFCIKDVGSCRRVDLICPTCNNAIVGQPYRPNYCKHCGQALKWGEEE